ncbi:GNAT family N-acetyltransferase [Nocardiopsis sediminis]|uniref:GNAT family N-acetyltransferase n=1 Tax=Nocardiopsis sediminis TaxID=1778267 RepID=A0ABV8FU36_9ACTN
MTDVTGVVGLVRVDDDVLEGLLDVAVGDADPEDVMPAVPGPPGWTQRRRDAFRAFHRARYPGLAAPPYEITYAVTEDGHIRGSVRLRRPEERPEALETGIWLGRSARGRGIGTAAISAVVDAAAQAGAATVLADTTPGNAAMLSVLRRTGAVLVTDTAAGRVDAELRTAGRDRV